MEVVWRVMREGCVGSCMLRLCVQVESGLCVEVMMWVVSWFYVWGLNVEVVCRYCVQYA